MEGSKTVGSRIDCTLIGGASLVEDAKGEHGAGQGRADGAVSKARTESPCRHVLHT